METKEETKEEINRNKWLKKQSQENGNKNIIN